MALQGPAGRPRTIVMAPPVLLLLLALAGISSPAAARPSTTHLWSEASKAGADQRRRLAAFSPPPPSPPSPPPCGPKTLGACCTGSPGFWLNNGLCQWPVNTLTVGTVTYDKAQMVRIMDLATGSLPNEYKPAQSLLKLAYQLIPAMLGQANYAQGDCQLPSYIATNITAGVALVGDRLIPPFGDGLCPCCGGSTSTTTCPSTSVCRTSLGGQTCRQLDSSDINMQAVLAPWNVNGECGVNTASPPPSPPSPSPPPPPSPSPPPPPSPSPPPPPKPSPPPPPSPSPPPPPSPSPPPPPSPSPPPPPSPSPPPPPKPSPPPPPKPSPPPPPSPSPPPPSPSPPPPPKPSPPPPPKPSPPPPPSPSPPPPPKPSPPPPPKPSPPPPPSPSPPPPSPSPPPPPKPSPPPPPSPSPPPPPSPSPPPPSPSPPPPKPSPPPPPSPSPPPPSPSPPPPPSPSPPPPPSPSPPPPPSPRPPSPIANGASQMSCTCGYITQLTVGLATRDGLEYAAKLTLYCSDGSVVQDPVTSLLQVRNDTGAVCNATSLVQTGPLAGGCTAMTIQYDRVDGNEVDTQLGGAGREGSFTASTATCPTGQIMLGLAFQRYSPTLGSNPVLNGVINSVTAVCGVPSTTGACAPKSPPPPPSPRPPSPSPPPSLRPPVQISNGAFSLSCGCGYATSVTVGMVDRNGKQFASKISLACSDGSILRDPVSSYVGVVRNATSAVCNATSLVTTGPLAGGCTAMTIHSDQVDGREADTRLGTAGRTGAVVTSTIKCPAGTVMLGLNPKRYSATLGTSAVLTGLLNSITANCGVPKTTGVCAPKQPPSPPPRPPPPVRTPQNTAVRRECSCGYVSSLEIGFISVGGRSYASRMNVRCSSGQVLKDTTTTLPTTWQTTPACVAGGKLTSGPNAGACTSFAVRYDKVLSQQADVGIVNAGRAGTNSVTVRCSSGVLIGIAFSRYSGGPGFNSLNNIMNTVTAVCGPPATKACPSPPPPPPVKTAQGWGDPHFKGFDGSRFDFHGNPGWYDVLSSKSPSLSLSTRMERSKKYPDTTYMKEYDLTVNNTKVAVSLLAPLPSSPNIWRLTASVNGRVLTPGTTTTPNGIKVTYAAGGVGKYGTAKVEAGFITISMIQKWRPDRAELAEFLDLNIMLSGKLQLPVTGILGPSYTKAVSAAAAAAGPVAGAAATVPVFSAGLDMSET